MAMSRSPSGPIKVKIAKYLDTAQVQSCEAALCSPTDQHELEVEDTSHPEIKHSSERRVSIISDVPAHEGQRAVVEGKPEEEEWEKTTVMMPGSIRWMAKAYCLEASEGGMMLEIGVLLLLAAMCLAIGLFGGDAPSW